MEFLYPNILYGLLAVIIPILVHLFNFRRYRKVYFSNVQMLKSIHKKTKKQSEIKHLVILLFRILTVVAIIMAFAHPIIPNKQSKLTKQEHQYISIYLDNSFSMTHLGESGTLLNEAQNMALNILDSYKNDDKFHLITNDMLGKHHRWFNKMEMTQNIMSVQAVHLQQSVSHILQREAMLREELATKQKAILYLLSDYQKNMTLSHQMAADTNLMVRLIPLQNNPVNNISVDSIWFEYPVQLPQTVSVLFVKVSNSGNELSSNIPLRLFIEDEQKAVVSIDLEPQKSKVIQLSFTNKKTGSYKGRVELDDYPIIFDDRLFFTFNVKNLFKTTMIYEGSSNPYLNHLFKNDSMIEWTSYPTNSPNYKELKYQDLIILNELQNISSGLQNVLNQYLLKGGQILLIPPSDGKIGELNKWLSQLKAPLYGGLDTVATRIDNIDKNLSFYERVFDKQMKKTEANQKVDLPHINKYFPILSGTKSDVLLKTQGGASLLTSTKTETGKLFQLAIPLSLDYSQFPEHALFVAVFYQMIMQTHQQKKLYETIGSGKPLEMVVADDKDETMADDVLHIKQGEIEWIPEIKRKNKNEFALINIKWPQEGIYKIEFRKKEIEQIAVNYDRSESDFSIWSTEELLQQIAELKLSNFQVINTSTQQVSSRLIQMDQGISLWKWFVVLAILFIFVETIILRLWK